MWTLHINLDITSRTNDTAKDVSRRTIGFTESLVVLTIVDLPGQELDFAFTATSGATSIADLQTGLLGDVEEREPVVTKHTTSRLGEQDGARLDLRRGRVVPQYAGGAEALEVQLRPVELERSQQTLCRVHERSRSAHVNHAVTQIRHQGQKGLCVEAPAGAFPLGTHLARSRDEVSRELGMTRDHHLDLG